MWSEKSSWDLVIAWLAKLAAAECVKSCQMEKSETYSVRLQRTIARSKNYDESCMATELTVLYHGELLVIINNWVLAGNHLSEKLWKKCLCWRRGQAKWLLKIFLTLTLYDQEMLAGWIHTLDSQSSWDNSCSSYQILGGSSSQFIPWHLVGNS